MAIAVLKIYDSHLCEDLLTVNSLPTLQSYRTASPKEPHGNNRRRESGMGENGPKMKRARRGSTFVARPVKLLNCDLLPPVMQSSGGSVSGPSATLTLSDSASRRISPCCHSSFFLWAHDCHVWQTHALRDARLRISDHVVLRVHVS